MLSGSYMHDCSFNLEAILLVFSCLLNACRFQLSPMHVHCYYYLHRSVMQVKGNYDVYDELIEVGEAGMNSTSLVFVNMISSSFLIQLIMNKHICNDN